MKLNRAPAGRGRLPVQKLPENYGKLRPNPGAIVSCSRGRPVRPSFRIGRCPSQIATDATPDPALRCAAAGARVRVAGARRERAVERPVAARADGPRRTKHGRRDLPRVVRVRPAACHPSRSSPHSLHFSHPFPPFPLALMCPSRHATQPVHGRRRLQPESLLLHDGGHV